MTASDKIMLGTWIVAFLLATGAMSAVALDSAGVVSL